MPAMVVMAALAATEQAALAGPVVRRAGGMAGMSPSPAMPRLALMESMWTRLVATRPAVPVAMAEPVSAALAERAATVPFPVVMVAMGARQQL